MMPPVMEAKRAAQTEYKRSLTEKALFILRLSNSKVQRTARICANEDWLELGVDIQNAAASDNIRGKYGEMKTELGPMPSKTSPFKSSSGQRNADGEMDGALLGVVRKRKYRC